jgi:hypothetical protein
MQKLSCLILLNGTWVLPFICCSPRNVNISKIRIVWYRNYGIVRCLKFLVQIFIVSLVSRHRVLSSVIFVSALCEECYNFVSCFFNGILVVHCIGCEIKTEEGWCMSLSICVSTKTTYWSVLCMQLIWHTIKWQNMSISHAYFLLLHVLCVCVIDIRKYAGAV